METLLYILGASLLTNIGLGFYFKKLTEEELAGNAKKKRHLKEEYEPLLKNISDLEQGIKQTVSQTNDYNSSAKITVTQNELTDLQQQIDNQTRIEIPKYQRKLSRLVALAAPILAEIARRAAERRRQEEAAAAERRRREAASRSSSSSSSYRGGGGRSGGSGASGGW